MFYLVLGLILFIGAHSLRELRLREPVVNRLGEGAYKGAYSLVALAGLLLIVWGKSASPFIMIYEPRYDLRDITHFAMLPAFILFVAGNVPGSHLRSTIRNPMLLGTFIWAAAHLWANGDLASLLLFGSIGAWAGVKFITMTLAGSGPAVKPSLVWDAVTVTAGFIGYGLVTVYHGQLFGIGLNFA